MKSNFCDFLSKLDSFGAPVNLTVNGNRSFKTKMGGLVTLIFTFSTLLYAIYLAFIMVQRNETSFNQNFISNYYNEKHVISSVVQVADKKGNVANETNFNIAFGIFTDDLKLVENFS